MPDMGHMAEGWQNGEIPESSLWDETKIHKLKSETKK